MSRVNNVPNQWSNVKTLDDLKRFVSIGFESILSQFNGKVDFGDNVRTFGPVTAALTSAAATRVPHSLGRVPMGYFVVNKDAPCDVYQPNSDVYIWTPTQIYVQGDATANVSLLLF